MLPIFGDILITTFTSLCETVSYKTSSQHNETVCVNVTSFHSFDDISFLQYGCLLLFTKPTEFVVPGWVLRSKELRKGGNNGIQCVAKSFTQ